MRFQKGKKYKLNKEAKRIFNVDGCKGYDYVIACADGFWAADCNVWALISLFEKLTLFLSPLMENPFDTKLQPRSTHAMPDIRHTLIHFPIKCRKTGQVKFVPLSASCLLSEKRFYTAPNRKPESFERPDIFNYLLNYV